MRNHTIILASSYQNDDCHEADEDDAEPDHFVFLGVELIGVRAGRLAFLLGDVPMWDLSSLCTFS